MYKRIVSLYCRLVKGNVLFVAKSAMNAVLKNEQHMVLDDNA